MYNKRLSNTDKVTCITNGSDKVPCITNGSDKVPCITNGSDKVPCITNGSPANTDMYIIRHVYQTVLLKVTDKSTCISNGLLPKKDMTFIWLLKIHSITKDEYHTSK